MKNRILLFLLIFMMLIGKMYSRDGTEPEGYVPNKGVEDPPAKTMTIKSPLNVKTDVVNVTFTVNGDNPITEDNGTTKATVTVSLTKASDNQPWPVPTGKTITVSMGYGGTASMGGTNQDYNFDTDVSITAGSSSGDFEITARYDVLFEANETIDVYINSVDCATNCDDFVFEADPQHEIITITDKTTEPVVTLSVVDNINDVKENAVDLGLDPKTYVTATIDYSLENIRTPITVDLGFSDFTNLGDATTDDDYTTDGTTIIIPEYTGTPTTIPEVEVTIHDDNYYEGNENINVTITSITADDHTTWSSASTVIIAIIDNEILPTVSLSADPSSIAEGLTSTITATLFPNPCQFPVTVNLGLSGTATQGVNDDYTLTSPITIEGKLTGTGTQDLEAKEDDIHESTESVIIDITDVNSVEMPGILEEGTQQQTVLITDDDAAPTVTLSVNNAIVTEDTGGTTTSKIKATLSAAAAEDVVVDLNFVYDGVLGTYRALKGTDYNTDINSITIDAGDLFAIATLTVIDDGIYEHYDSGEQEKLLIEISNVTGGGATEDGDQEKVITITDNEVIPTVMLIASPNSITEEGGVSNLNAELSHRTAYHDVVLDFAMPGAGTAEVADYTANATTVTIPMGDLTAGITITGEHDLIYEGEETVIVTMTSDANATSNDNVRTVTIIDDESQPTVILTGTNTITEGGAATTLTATMSEESGEDVIVYLEHSGDTEIEDWTTDVNSPTLKITITAGQTVGTVDLSTFNDVIYEGQEIATFEIATIDGAAEDGDQSVIITVDDNETAPDITATKGNDITEGGTEVTTITVTTTTLCEHDITVTINYPYDDALPAKDAEPSDNAHPDYSGEQTSVTILAGNTTATFDITCYDDNIEELDVESILVDITAATADLDEGNVSMATLTDVTVEINDDDIEPSITLFVVDNPEITENGGVLATITATLSHPTELGIVDITYNLSGTADRTVVAPATEPDFTIIASVPVNTASISTFDTECTIVITPVNETPRLYEGDETVIVEVTDVNLANEGNSEKSQTITIIDDEEEPLVTLTTTEISIDEDGNPVANATITATLNYGRQDGDVEFAISFSGTATEDVDYNDTGGTPDNYTAATNTFSIPASTTTGTFDITADDDNIFESPDETIVIDIVSVTNGEDNSDPINITIVDDEAATPIYVKLEVNNDGNPTVGTSSTIITEDQGANPTATIIATLLDGSDNPIISSQDVVVTLSYNPVGADIAIKGVDYTGGLTTITIPAGELTSTITTFITAIDDNLYENDNGGAEDEDVNIKIESVSGADIHADNEVDVSITDVQTKPVVTLTNNGPINENEGPVTITATLNYPADEECTFDLTLADGDAEGGTGTNYPADDFVKPTTAATYTFAIGETETTGEVTINDDDYTENDEDFTCTVTPTLNCVAGTGTTVTILNDDAEPIVTLSAGVGSITELNGTTTIDMHLDHPHEDAVTITLGKNAATTAPDGNYNNTSIFTTCTIGAGTLTATAILTANDNVIYDGNRNVVIDITATTNATELVEQQVTVVIEDDEGLPKVSLSTATGTITEGTGTTVTLTADPESDHEIVVMLSYSGTAIYGTDYNEAVTTVTIPANTPIATGVEFDLDPIDDNIYEKKEKIIIDIIGVIGGVEDVNPIQQQKIVKILNDDPEPTATLSVDEETIIESGGMTTVWVTLSNPTYETVTAHLVYEDGTGLGDAIEGTDYNDGADKIIIAPYNLTGFTTVSAIPDNINEYDESFDITMSDEVNTTVCGSCVKLKTITIADDDDDPVVTLTASPEEVVEGTDFTITATLSHPNSAEITVNLGNKVDATATFGVDYGAFSEIVIAGGSIVNSSSFITEDGISEEGDETVIPYITSFVMEGGVLNAVMGDPNEATVTIIDADPAPIVSIISSGTVTEGSTVTLTLNLATQSFVDKTVTLAYSSANIYCHDVTDYSGTTTVVIPANTSTKTFVVNAIDDNIYEDDETFTVTITNIDGNGVISQAAGSTEVTITANDVVPTVTLSVDATNIVENGGVATVTATLSNATERGDVVVDVEYSDTQTADNNDDYTHTGDITITAGDLTGTTTITAVQDTKYESPGETVMPYIFSYNGAGIGSTITPSISYLTVIINDDDPEPAVSFVIKNNNNIEEDGETSAKLKFSLDRMSNYDVTVNVAYTGLTATNAVDYTTGKASFKIIAGSQQKTTADVITAIDDAIAEGEETIKVEITGVMNGTETGVQEQIVKIVDDETPIVTIDVSSNTITEGTGTVTVTLTMDKVATSDVVVTLGYTGDAARLAAGNTGNTTMADFQIDGGGFPPLTLTIPNGHTTKSFVIEANDDSPLYDNGEDIIITITGVTGANNITGNDDSEIIIINEPITNMPNLTLSNNGAITEGVDNTGISTVTATLDKVAGIDVIIKLGFTGSASDAINDDYTINGGTFVNTSNVTYHESSWTILAGDTKATLTINAIDDWLYEMTDNATEDGYVEDVHEDIGVYVVSSTNAKTFDDQRQNITIIDAQDEPQVRFITTLSGVTNNNSTLDLYTKGSSEQKIDEGNASTDAKTAYLTPVLQWRSVHIVTLDVNHDVVNSTATESPTTNVVGDNDYVLTAGTVFTIYPGKTYPTSSLAITTVPDNVNEADETVIYNIVLKPLDGSANNDGDYSHTQFANAEDETATVIIEDEDPLTLNLWVKAMGDNVQVDNTLEINENGSDIAIVGATLGAQADVDITVNLGYTNAVAPSIGYAKANDDYRKIPADNYAADVWVIKAGETVVNTTILAHVDGINYERIYEGNEHLDVWVTSISDGNGGAVTITDNTTVNVLITDSDNAPKVWLTTDETEEDDSTIEEDVANSSAKIGAKLEHLSVWPVDIKVDYNAALSEAELVVGTQPDKSDFTQNGNPTISTATITVNPMSLNSWDSGTEVTITVEDDNWYEGDIDELIHYNINGLVNKKGDNVTITTDGPHEVANPVLPVVKNSDVEILIEDDEAIPSIELYLNNASNYDEDIVENGGTVNLYAQIFNNTFGADEELKVYLHFYEEITLPVNDLTALSGKDYTVGGSTLTNSSLMITIPAYGNVSAATAITAMEDDIFEDPNEHIIIDIEGEVKYNDTDNSDEVTCTETPTDANLNITITDDDDMPTVNAIFINNDHDSQEQEVHEEDLIKNYEVFVTLSHPTSDDVSVFVTYSGAATYGVDGTGDYNCTVGTNGDNEFPDTWFLIPASHTKNNKSSFKTLSFYDDDIYEDPNEHVIIDITGVSALNTITQDNSVDFTIIDDEELPIVTDLTVVNKSTSESDKIYEKEDATDNSTIATITATMDNFTTEDVVITLGSDNGTGNNAAEDNDYVLENTITIPAGEKSGTCIVTANYDEYYEGDPDESFEVWADLVTGATLGYSSLKLAVTIVDAQVKPEITVTAYPDEIAEDGGYTDITFEMDVLSHVDIDVTYDVIDGTTEGDHDFTNDGNGTVTINIGELSSSFRITSKEDCYYEGINETLNVDNFAVTDATTATLNSSQAAVTVTIIDAETVPELTLTTSTDLIYENGTPNTSVLTATLNNGTTEGEVSIPLVYSGMATHIDDASASVKDFTGNLFITILKSEDGVADCNLTSSTDIISIDEDPVLYEGAETILINIGGVTNANTSGVQQRTITIVDDETEPTASMEVSTGDISEDGPTSTNVTAELDYARQYGDVTLSIVYSGDYEENDFTGAVSSLTIPAGTTTSAGFIITAYDDDIDEDTETINISIEDVDNAINDNFSALVNIIDNDALPIVTITPAEPHEIKENLSSGNNFKNLTVKLSHATERSDIVVNFTHDASSTAGTDDYELDYYSVTIPMNETVKSFTISSVHDLVYEGDEIVYMNVTTDESYATTTGGDATFNVTIIDDEVLPLVTLSSTHNTINEPEGSFTLKAELNNATALDNVEVTLDFTGGDANVGDDYTLSGSIITIPQGETFAVLEIPVIDDNMYEIDEDIIVNITGVNNAGEDGDQTETITIVSDDVVPTVTLTTSDETIEEDNGIAELTVTLSHPTYLDVDVDYSFTGTATTDLDYTNGTEPITITSGVLSSSITLSSLPDDIYEGNETVIVDIDVTDADELDAQQVTVNIIDAEIEPTVTLSADVNEIAEDGGQSVITATLSHATIHPVAVTLDYTGTATDDADYTHEAKTVIEIENGLTGTVTITGVLDDFYEGVETVIVDIIEVVNATEVETQQETVTISDGQVYPTVTIAVDNAIIDENDASVITATLNNKTLEEVVLTFAYTGTADYDVDYEAGLTLTIPSNTYTGTVTVTSIDDVIDENEEDVIVNIVSVTNANEGSLSEATIIITDNDATPTVILTVDNSDINEEDGVAILTATLSHPTHIGDVSVSLLVDAASTALSGIDYELSTLPIVIPMGSLSSTTTISSIDDLMFEDDETVIVDIDGTVTNATEYGIQTQTVTILNTDLVPTVTLTTGDYSVEEDNGKAVLTVTLSNPTHLDVVVDFTYTGTALQGTDYNIANTSLTIPSGYVEETVTLSSVPDAIHEGDETVIVDINTITNANEATAQQEIITILDAETEPIITLSADVNTILEDGSEAIITATLSHYSTQPVTATLAYTGTADYGVDYENATTLITIPPMALSRTTVVKSIVDYIYEGVDETVVVDIFEVTNAVEVITEQEVITITDAQVYPIVDIETTPISISENGGTSVITATLNNKTIEDVSVEFEYAGTALNGIDYSVISTIDIPANNISGVINITALDDDIYEGDETIIIDIDNVTNANIGTFDNKLVTITEDDSEPVVTLSVNPVSINEAGGVADINVTLSHLSVYPVIVNIASTAGTATEGDDYYYGNSSITIDALETTGETTVTAVDDGIYEGDTNETFDVTCTVTSGGTGGGTETVTIIDGQSNPPTADMSVNISSVAENGGLANVSVTLDYPTVEDVEIEFTFSGEAVKEVDYNTTAAANSITIASGDVSGLFTFNSLSDDITEGDEDAVIDMTVTNATEGVGTQTIMILDDDVLPVVSMSLNTENINEGEEAVVTVELTNPSDEDITVNFVYSGTAIAGADDDYTTSENQVIVTALTTSITMTIYTIDDGILEGDETVIVDIESVSSNSVEAGNQQVTLIVHDIQSAINANLAVNGSGDCQNGTFNITILAAEDGVEYKAYFNDFNKPLNTKTGDGSDLEIEIEERDLKIGDNTISIYADNVNVINDEITLANTALVTLYENYIVKGDTVDLGSNGTVSIIETQENVDYEVYVGSSNKITTVAGTGYTVNVPIASEYLPKSSTDNTYDIIVNAVMLDETKTCQIDDINNDADFIYVIENPSVPQAFSPNGDGVNDNFFIKDVQIYEYSSIVIMNRHGQKVYEAAPYKNDWDGKTMFGVEGEDLPEGTYFYILKLGTNEEPMKGYVYIKR